MIEGILSNLTVNGDIYAFHSAFVGNGVLLYYPYPSHVNGTPLTDFSELLVYFYNGTLKHVNLRVGDPDRFGFVGAVRCSSTLYTGPASKKEVSSPAKMKEIMGSAKTPTETIDTTKTIRGMGKEEVLGLAFIVVIVLIILVLVGGRDNKRDIPKR